MTTRDVTITPMNGVTDYGGSFDTVQGKYRDGLITLQGLLKLPTGGITAGTVIAVLDEVSYAPDKTLLFRTETAGGSVRLDVRNTGEIVYQQGTLGAWISLSGITYNLIGEINVFDYAVVNNKWCFHQGNPWLVETQDYSDSTRFKNEVIFWDGTGQKSLYVQDSDASNFIPMNDYLNCIASDSVIYNGTTYARVAVNGYGANVVKHIYDKNMVDVTSRFTNLYGDVFLYLAIGTVGGESPVNNRSRIRAEFIEVRPDQLHGGGINVIPCDGVSDYGYVETNANETLFVYGEFFPPYGG